MFPICNILLKKSQKSNCNSLDELHVSIVGGTAFTQESVTTLIMLFVMLPPIMAPGAISKLFIDNCDVPGMAVTPVPTPLMKPVAMLVVRNMLPFTMSAVVRMYIARQVLCT